jgi:flagellar biosynthesis GTPase FlhF
MLTLNQKNSKTGEQNSRVAIHVNGRTNKLTPFYAEKLINEESVIPLKVRANINDYIDVRLFKNLSTRTYAHQKIQEQVTNLINNRLLVPREYKNTAIDVYYNKILDNIKKKIIYLYIAERSCRFYQCPTERIDQVDNILVNGPSGVGKTWWTADYAFIFHQMYPDRKIYLISHKPEDKAFDCLDFIIRVPMEEVESFVDIDVNVRSGNNRYDDDGDDDDIDELGLDLHNNKRVKLTENNDDEDIPCNQQEAVGERFPAEEVVEENLVNDLNHNIDNINNDNNNNKEKKQDDVVDVPENFILTQNCIPARIEPPKEPKKPKQTKSELKKQNKAAIETITNNKKKDISTFANSLIIIDDIENVMPIELRNKIYDFKKFLSMLGRSSNINLVFCCHLLSGRSINDKATLLESTILVIFPEGVQSNYVLTYLSDVLKFDPPNMQRIRNVQGWLMIHKTNPITFITKDKIWTYKPSEIPDKKLKNLNKDDLW